MAAIDSLKIITGFASAYPWHACLGVCTHMLGCNWRQAVRVVSFDEMGMDKNLKIIKTAARKPDDTLDHHYLSDIPPFNSINSTAENTAAYFYRNLSATLNTDRIRVYTVTLWETERACLRYTEEP